MSLTEGLEDRLLVGGRNADPGIASPKLRRAPSGTGRRHERDRAALGELDGVHEEIRHDLLQALRIGMQSIAARAMSAMNVTSWPASRMSITAVRSANNGSQLDDLHLDPHAAGFDARQIDQIGDEVGEVARRSS